MTKVAFVFKDIIILPPCEHHPSFRYELHGIPSLINKDWWCLLGTVILRNILQGEPRCSEHISGELHENT